MSMGAWLEREGAGSSVLGMAPPLTSSGDSSDSASTGPDTPCELSPAMYGETYVVPPAMDAITLPIRAGTPQQAHYQTHLPNILDPATAANVPVRNLCCIGAGYVGGPTAAVIAYHNPQIRVTVVDRDQARINAWKGRHLPIQENGLIDIVRAARDGVSNVVAGPPEEQRASSLMRAPNLFFSTQCIETIAESDMILISVNTPTKGRGIGAGRATDMTAVEGAVRDVAIHARPGTILVEKSTVPCKTGQLIKDIMEAHRPGLVFPVLSNPEFLAEGTAVRDLMAPDRVVIGCESTISGHRAAAALANLYAAWVPRHRIVPINIWSSELCKLAANAMLAQRVSSINAISAICEKTGADVSEIATSVGMDPRIGPQFLKAGLGFGGSCFRKDIASLTYLAESLGLTEVSAYWQAVLDLNSYQRDRFARQVIAALNNSLRGKKITILGYAFKKNTGDARESPALDVIRMLLEEGPRRISIFDPWCSAADIRQELAVLALDRTSGNDDQTIEICADVYDACAASHAVLVLTDWDMFKVKAIQSISKPDATPSSEIINPASPTTLLHGTTVAQDATRIDVSGGIPRAKPGSASPLPVEIQCRLLPQPSCLSICHDCASRNESPAQRSQNHGQPLDWSSVAKTVKEPRWVFDGRAILDARTMSMLGFRLVSLGRTSLYD